MHQEKEVDGAGERGRAGAMSQQPAFQTHDFKVASTALCCERRILGSFRPAVFYGHVSADRW